MFDLFVNKSDFDDDITDWNVSNVLNMQGLFFDASSFNQDISNWDVSNVNNMMLMFKGASSFNQDITGWDISNDTSLFGMFDQANQMLIIYSNYIDSNGNPLPNFLFKIRHYTNNRFI